MIAALLLAACLTPPYFPADMSGPVCTAANQTLECQCSECFMWDPVPEADWYNVRRVDQDGTVHDPIGSVYRTAAFTDEFGDFHMSTLESMWCVAKDNSTPIEGRRYIYTVQGCNAHGCGVYSSDSVAYTGAPYWCYGLLGRITCPVL